MSSCDTCRIAAENPEAAMLDKNCDDCIVRFLENIPMVQLPSALRSVCRDAGHVERIRERLFNKKEAA